MVHVGLNKSMYKYWNFIWNSAKKFAKFFFSRFYRNRIQTTLIKDEKRYTTEFRAPIEEGIKKSMTNVSIGKKAARLLYNIIYIAVELE